MTTQQQVDRVMGGPPASEREGPGNGIPKAWAVVRTPLPHLRGRWLTRCVARTLLLALRPCLLEVRGAERVDPRHDPFLFVLNHSQRAEALLIPALLAHLRAGKLVHFMADWNFSLLPPVWLIYKCGDVITVNRKPARPRFLNVFRPWLNHPIPSHERAAARLASGTSVGIFPEGTVNRNRRRLLPGQRGAAELALRACVPVVPAGIRFPLEPADRPLGAWAKMVVEIGEPIAPPEPGTVADGAAVREHHARLMQAVSNLCGKDWQPRFRGDSHETT
jgi:1-acyl-sn-glycerol-3-phosphate acyltransferase